MSVRSDQSGIDGDGEAHSGIQKAIVIEEVRCPSPERIGIERPVLQRNREAKLGFFIALAMQGDEREILAAHESQQRARCGDKRRGLVEMTVKRAKDQIDFWNAQCRANARASGVFHQAAGEMRLAQAAVQRQPISDAKLIFEEQGRQTSGHIFRVTKIAAEIRIGWIVEIQTEDLVVLLAEAVNAGAQVVPAFDVAERRLAACVVRRAVVGGGERKVLRAAFERGPVEMVEGRNGKRQTGVESAHPGKCDEGVAFAVGIAEMLGGSVIRIIGIERHLIEIAPKRSHEAELVCRIGVVNQRPKSAEAVSLILNDGGGWCFKAQTRAIEVDAAIVSQLPGVTAEIEVVISLIEIAEAGDELSVIVSFESSAWRDVKNSVGAVAEVGRVAAALHLEHVDVFWIDLRTEIACDVCVWNGHSIDKPAYLVASANVELIVREVGPGNMVGDHGQAVGAVGARSLLDVRAVETPETVTAY